MSSAASSSVLALERWHGSRCRRGPCCVRSRRLVSEHHDVGQVPGDAFRHPLGFEMALGGGPRRAPERAPKRGVAECAPQRWCQAVRSPGLTEQRVLAVFEVVGDARDRRDDRL